MIPFSETYTTIVNTMIANTDPPAGTGTLLYTETSTELSESDILVRETCKDVVGTEIV